MKNKFKDFDQKQKVYGTTMKIQKSLKGKKNNKL